MMRLGMVWVAHIARMIEKAWAAATGYGRPCASVSIGRRFTVFSKVRGRDLPSCSSQDFLDALADHLADPVSFDEALADELQRAIVVPMRCVRRGLFRAPERCSMVTLNVSSVSSTKSLTRTSSRTDQSPPYWLKRGAGTPYRAGPDGFDPDRLRPAAPGSAKAIRHLHRVDRCAAGGRQRG